ncbi:LamG-like jellyroll fold domain-containing protein [Streptomyces sp. NRRL S-623]|uniref:LamG-like jellyroll fold domain-containing protein n=1 Tax=Streptomyces sp. NRRL S-623 TaxID=1463916 RepID=UPI00131C934C|nr:LamG-like jellyroll fold domain-containing protein [Streptomyces sp. NRRL S-623]
MRPQERGRTRPCAPGRIRGLVVLLAAVLLGTAALPGRAAAVDGPPASDAYSRPSVRAMTWNVCGEAGGSTPGTGAYCPDRNEPQAKAAAVGEAVRARDLNAVMLQEVCSGPFLSGLNSGSGGPSQLDRIAAELGPEWSFRWAEVWRPATAAFPQGSSYCRAGLTGTLSVAIGVKGRIDWQRTRTMPVPVDAGQSRTQALCVGAAGWESHLCTAHVANFDAAARQGRMTQAEADGLYADQIGVIEEMAAGLPSVVVGGDFNTRLRAKLQPLYDTLYECDERSYFPGDTAAEPTHFSPATETTDPATGAITDSRYSTARLDYLFSSEAFTGCDSWTEKADRADYTPAAQPSCSTVATPPVCTPTGTSDHAPVYGSTQGGPGLDWRMNGTASGGSLGLTGTPSPGASWSTGHGGALELDGVSGTVTAPGPVVDTRRSFTVSAWAKADPEAGISAVLAQDGTVISGAMLWYNAPDRTWRFGMPRADGPDWNVDQVISRTQAVPGVWTRLTGVHDAVAGTITLYVDGAPAGTVAHTATWAANGPFVVGRDLVKGRANAFWDGQVRGVEAYDYPMTAAQALSHSRTLTAPTVRAALPSTAGAGCQALGGYGTVSSRTPTLTVHVAHPDPSKQVWAEFGLWDNTDPAQPQPVALGTPGSVSGKVVGRGTVSLTAPTLIDGHSYGWRARTADGTTSSAISSNCHFRVAAP